MRSIIDQLLLATFLLMTGSGGAIYWRFAGGATAESGASILDLDHRAWLGLHLVSAAIFAVLGILHIGLNWHAMVHHLRSRTSHRIVFKWETAAVLAVTVWLLVSAALGLPPASTLLAVGMNPTNEMQADSPAGDVESDSNSAIRGRTRLPPGHPPT